MTVGVPRRDTGAPRPVVTPGDRAYDLIISACALLIPLLLVALIIVTTIAAGPTLRDHLTDLLLGREWNVARGRFGAAPAIIGTVISALGATVIATPVALCAAVFVSELAPRRLRGALGFLLDTLAAIPSVVYGLWGALVLVPWLRTQLLAPVRAADLFGMTGPAYGPSLLAAILILAVMILPFIAAISREVLLAVPTTQREAALALGATRWEMIRDAVLPYARSGIIGGILLGLGRALGETIAVAMVIGNRHAMPHSLFDPAESMAALLANEFAEASDDAHLGALMAVSAVLLLFTLLVNLGARLLVARVARPHGVVPS